jgi:hypothetical protein
MSHFLISWLLYIETIEKKKKTFLIAECNAIGEQK